MNTEIKIIDLLNMIAEGKELPKKFMYKEHLYYRQKTKGICFRCDELNEIFEECLVLEDLNDTVEIIEEDNNKIENISWLELFDILPKKYTEEQNKAVVYLGKKINEIIGKVNKENNI